MSKTDNKSIKIIRWAARIFCLAFVALFLVFFIGEGGFQELPNLPYKEIILLMLIPVAFSAGAVLELKSELWGGIIIILSVIGFNAIDIASSRGFSGVEFWYLLIPGIVFVVLACLKKKGVKEWKKSSLPPAE